MELSDRPRTGPANFRESDRSPSGRPSTLSHPGVFVPPPLVFAAGWFLGWAVERHWFPPLGWKPSELYLTLVGLPVVWAGVGVGALAMVQFLRARTSIVPHHPAKRLVTAGLYRRSRNPMYLALLLVYVGFAILKFSLGAFVTLPLVWLAVRYAVVAREERYLSARFGDEYRMYRERVRRWI